MVNLKPYTLTFMREAEQVDPPFPRYARQHVSLQQAQSAARKVAAALQSRGVSAARHPAVIYGPRGQIFTA